MTAKKRNDDQTVATGGDAFAYDMSKMSDGFTLEDLLAIFNEKNGEASQRKFSIAERIVNARKNIARIQNTITNLEIKAQVESGQVFVNLVVRPVADEIRNIFSNAQVDVFGPFGLSGQATLTLSKKNGGQPAKSGDSRSITLLPSDAGISIRDYSESSNEYAPGSPEYLSGWNHPVVSVPAENAVEFIVNWLMK